MIWSQLSKFNHPNLIRLRNFVFSHEGGLMYIMAGMDYYPTDLGRVVVHCRNKMRSLPWKNMQLCAYQIARGPLFIHSRGVCHRVLKPSNVMVSHLTNVVKICDFGSAKVLREGESHTAYMCSRYYRAPELLLNSGHYSTSTDMWSFACVLAELILLKPLFHGANSMDQLIEIVCVRGTPSEAEVASMNPHLRDCRFPPLPERSPTDVFWHMRPEHEALKLLDALLQYDPRGRPSPLAVLGHSFFDGLRSAQLDMELHGPVPPLFDFSELESAIDQIAVAKLVPEHISLSCEGPSAASGAETEVVDNTCTLVLRLGFRWTG